MGLTMESPDFCAWVRRRLQEVRGVSAGRLCQPEWRRKCQAEAGAFAQWACQVCQEYIRPEVVSPWTWHLLWLHRLKKAGYPFRANDLSLETWMLMGLVEEVLGQSRGGKGGTE